MGGIPELLEEKNKRGPVAPSSSSPFLFFPPCMERNENISRGAPGSFLFFFLSLATGQTVVSHPSSLFLLRILLLFILVFSLSLFSNVPLLRGEIISKEPQKKKKKKKNCVTFPLSHFFIRPPPLPASDYADSPRSHFSFIASVHQ